MAIGREIPPTVIESKNMLRPGTNRPRARPSPMASRIQTANQRSRKDIFSITGVPVDAADCTAELIEYVILHIDARLFVRLRLACHIDECQCKVVA